MPVILVTIFTSMAGGLGISVIRLIIYIVAVLAVVTALVSVRQHYINVGWYKHKTAIERQDNISLDASKKVEERTQKCSDDNGFWDVITQGCKLQEEETVK